MKKKPGLTVLFLFFVCAAAVLLYANTKLSGAPMNRIGTGPVGKEIAEYGTAVPERGTENPLTYGNVSDGVTEPNPEAGQELSAEAVPTPTPEPEYVYRIPENSLVGMPPVPDGFYVSKDAGELASFLERDDVRKLIGDRTLVWNAETERIPDTSVRWYFDETILCIVWQEVEAEAVGTFSEVIIADGSQLRRKISSDELWSFAFETTSQFAADTDAVLAFGGDFYYHGRACGIGFYQRELYRFEPKSCDTCWVTADGDLLFTYREQIMEEEAAKRFAEENDVLFTLVFGPVLIDEYRDVTPELYLWGETEDTYARAALGLMDRHHYLTMNINCGPVGTEYYHLATLRQATEAMMKKGCRKAYALDGGQTATTVFGGQLINPVQFGVEKEISDIIYFASAVGAERQILPE